MNDFLEQKFTFEQSSETYFQLFHTIGDATYQWGHSRSKLRAELICNFLNELVSKSLDTYNPYAFRAYLDTFKDESYGESSSKAFMCERLQHNYKFLEEFIQRCSKFNEFEISEVSFIHFILKQPNRKDYFRTVRFTNHNLVKYNTGQNPYTNLNYLQVLNNKAMSPYNNYKRTVTFTRVYSPKENCVASHVSFFEFDKNKDFRDLCTFTHSNEVTANLLALLRLFQKEIRIELELLK